MYAQDSQNSKFPQIDNAQALRQLSYLGHKPQNVCLRFFYHSDDSRKNEDRGRKANRLDYKAIESYQRDGRGVYLVINPGGHEDKDIKQCIAIFCEWDDRSVEEQMLHWETVGFFEPTFTIYSGDKSAQPYWVFDQPISVEQWRELQRLLIEVMGADPSNKNPSRVFRLAGGWHVKPGREPRRTEIVQDSGKKYSPDQLLQRLLELRDSGIPANQPMQRAASNNSKQANGDILEVIGQCIPLKQRGKDWLGDCPFCNATLALVVKPEHQVFECLSCKTGGDADNYANSAADFLKKYQHSFSDPSKRIRDTPLQVPVPKSVPLEVCLSKESRSLLKSGVSQGGRNTNGAKLARDLIGTANYLSQSSQQFDGDPRQMLDDYASRCTPPLGTKEIDTIWHSALKDNPTPSCTQEGVNNCIKAWYRNNYVKPLSPSLSSERCENPCVSGGDDGSSKIADLPVQSLDLEKIKTQIREALLQNFSASGVETAKIKIRSENPKISERELNRLFETIERELEQKLEREDIAAEVDQLLKLGERSLDLSKILPKELATALTRWSSWLNLRPECALIAFLTTCSSLHKVGTELIIHRGRDFAVPPTLYSAMVSESGQRKSPLQRTIIRKPLGFLHREAREQYERELEEYEQKLKAWKDNRDGEKPKEPRQEIYFFTDATGEGIKAQAAAHPEKILFPLVDELAGLFNSHDKYRQGRGSDKQDLLSYFDGAGAVVLRSAGIKHDVDKIYMSIYGTIQPEVLKQYMKDCTDPDGTWGRFLFVNQPLAAATLDDDGFELDIIELLLRYYRYIARLLKIEYCLSREAFKRYQRIYNQLEQLRVSHPEAGMRAVYSKMEGYIGRLALNLHVIWELANGKTIPDPIIPLERVEQAIILAKFFMGQTRLIHANSMADYGTVSPHITKLIETSKRFDVNTGTPWIKAKTVGQGYNSRNRPKANEIRSWMREAEAMGKGVTRGTGMNMEFSWRPTDSPTSPLSSPPKVDLGDLVDKQWTPCPPPEMTINQALQERGGLGGLNTHIAFLDEVEVSFPSSSSLSEEVPLEKKQKFEDPSPPVHQGGCDGEMSNVSAVDIESTSSPPVNMESTSSPPVDKTVYQSEEVSWIIEQLKDLESEPQPHPRFTSQAQLLKLWGEIEQAAQRCEDELNQVCPNYWERFTQAYAEVMEVLPEELPAVKEPQFKQGDRIVSGEFFGTVVKPPATDGRCQVKWDKLSKEQLKRGVQLPGLKIPVEQLRLIE